MTEQKNHKVFEFAFEDATKLMIDQTSHRSIADAKRYYTPQEYTKRKC